MRTLFLSLPIVALLLCSGCAGAVEDERLDEEASEQIGTVKSAMMTPPRMKQGDFVDPIFFTWAWADRIAYLVTHVAMLTEAAYQQLAGPAIYAATRDMTDAERRDYLNELVKCQQTTTNCT